MKKDHGQKRPRQTARGQAPAQSFPTPGFHPTPALPEALVSLVSKVRQFNLEFYGVRCTSDLLTEEENSIPPAGSPMQEVKNESAAVCGEQAPSPGG